MVSGWYWWLDPDGVWRMAYFELEHEDGPTIYPIYFDQSSGEWFVEVARDLTPEDQLVAVSEPPPPTTIVAATGSASGRGPQ